jgi:uncharacterized protein (DUF362 family)/Pyruvate/2-oxoacid:ferredoxin oxidoreductase delta subunit
MQTRSIVAAARNEAHTPESVAKALSHLLEHLDPPLDAFVKRGVRVLVKVNMGCSKTRNPDERFTTHPVMVEALIRLLQDCGAVVSFGDDIARAGKHYEQIWKVTGMREVAKRTGATLVDFVSAGAREVRGGLLYPRKYLVTNCYFEADVVINFANCRSHANIVMSGAIKNMFGCVVGLRKQLIHTLFPENPRKFGRAIADIHRVIPADISFLDLTSVLEGHGVRLAVRPVHLILASTDPVALDSVAAHAIGYEELPIWTTYYGNKLGVGCDDLEEIGIRGVDWSSFEKPRLQYPRLPSSVKLPVYDRITAVVNHTILRPRPVITSGKCTGCGDCVKRCPVQCIEAAPPNIFRINLGNCADCGCCLKVCDVGAVNLEFVGVAKSIRSLVNRLPAQINPHESNSLDPAPRA